MGYDPARWHDLYIMLGGASAALTGLVFVGLSMHARAVAADPFQRARARYLTAGLVYITVISGAILVPGQGIHVLGAELIAGGCAALVVVAVPIARFPDRFPRDVKMRLALVVVACALNIAAGTSLLAHSGGGLYLLFPAALTAVVMNVFGAWSLLLGLAADS
jgi:modulator of FtsH protease